MSPRVNRRLRLLVPVFVLLIAAAIVLMVIFSPRMTKQAQSNATAAAPVVSAQANASTADTKEVESESTPAESTAKSSTESSTPAQAAASEETLAETAPVSAGEVLDLSDLKLVLHEVPEDEVLPSLGGLDDPAKAKMEVTFTRAGGGISSIIFSDIWLTAASNQQAKAYFAAKAAGNTDGLELPPEDMRYVLQREHVVPYGGYSYEVPLLAANMVNLFWLEGDAEAANEDPLEALKKVGVEAWTTVEGVPGLAKAAVIDATGRAIELRRQSIPLLAANHWIPTKPGGARAQVVNGEGKLALEVLRQFELANDYEIQMHQRVVNHTGRRVAVQWQQYGPPNLLPERTRYLDRRRFRFGYEFSESVDPNRMADVIADGGMLLEYADVAKSEEPMLWPNEQSLTEGYTLSWFASTSRYFAMAIFPLQTAEGNQRSLEPVVEKIERSIYTLQEEVLIETGLFSPVVNIPAAGYQNFSMGVYAGPLSSKVLDVDEPYVSLNMGGLLLYQISGFSCCAFCTFQWLAEFLLNVLSFLADHVVFDWGMAIIILVVIVRILLHPITRMSQVNMQKFSKQMQKLKPEMERLKERCGDDKKKFQQEQMKLMREHGVNPFQMLGCAPMLLQMPIWIALYAGLYFSYSLRQQPAFWGFFQLFDGWPFLADLAAPDHFFYTFQEPHEFLFWHMSGINLLPILLGVFFFIQQKYLTPQGAALTPEQQTQQKIMRVMTVIMFPLFLYTAPSGLTLYIMTSSIIGTLEGRHIRKQVDQMDLDAKPKRANASTIASRAATAGPKVGRDPQSRAYARMADRRKGGKGGRNRGGKRKG